MFISINSIPFHIFGESVGLITLIYRAVNVLALIIQSWWFWSVLVFSGFVNTFYYYYYYKFKLTLCHSGGAHSNEIIVSYYLLPTIIFKIHSFRFTIYYSFQISIFCLILHLYMFHKFINIRKCRTVTYNFSFNNCL